MFRQDPLPPSGHAHGLRHQLAAGAAIERAIGVIMQETRTTAEQARARLTSDAAAAGCTLAVLCAAVLTEAARPAATPAPTDAPLTRRRLATTSPERAREELAAAYRTPIRMTAPEPGQLFQIEHTDAGLFQAGEHRLPGRLRFTSQPAPQIVVARLLAGTAERHTPAGVEHLGAEDLFLTGQPATEHSATTHDAHVGTTTLPLPLLHKVASALPEQTRPLRFTSLRPATQALADHWRATGVYLGGLLDHPQLATEAPLLVANTAQLLAATALAVFPNSVTTTTDRPHDRTDATRNTVHRATTFIDEHAHQDLTLAEIARASSVTPRTLQYAFRRHLDTTPLAYLRDVRLLRAHRDLLDADPATTTVTQIAVHWGFLHLGRFASRYQDLFHTPPSTTLHT
ncbi:helix-turn-helix domain-containing protein [Streptomyces sp. NPDC007205]|uniref:helix-turn-helix domain-containing protein n=1 Tax=Streptomyces sp. NPDC007205 TaxID=3154316 RepID=UPI0033E00D61